jgi:RNA polymerase sigma-70 factor, ECF subfamily
MPRPSLLIARSKSPALATRPPSNRDSVDADLQSRIEEVYRQCGTRVYSLARRMLDNDADAEDVAQDVLLQVVRGLDNFRGESSIMTWLYRVTVNAALALRRKRAAIRERHTSESASDFYESSGQMTGFRAPPATPDAHALQGELRGRIEAAIARLPETYRDPFILSDVEHLSYADITEVLGLSLAAVKSRIHRARLMLRDALQPYVAGRSMM